MTTLQFRFGYDAARFALALKRRGIPRELHGRTAVCELSQKRATELCKRLGILRDEPQA